MESLFWKFLGIIFDNSNKIWFIWRIRFWIWIIRL